MVESSLLAKTFSPSFKNIRGRHSLTWRTFRQPWHDFLNTHSLFPFLCVSSFQPLLSNISIASWTVSVLLCLPILSFEVLFPLFSLFLCYPSPFINPLSSPPDPLVTLLSSEGASSRRLASGKKFSPSFVVLGGRRAPYVRLSICVKQASRLPATASCCAAHAC